MDIASNKGCILFLFFLQDFGAHELFSAPSSDGSDSENESSSAFSDGEKDDEPSSARRRGARGFKVDVLLEMAADSVEAKRQHLVNTYLSV